MYVEVRGQCQIISQIALFWTQSLSLNSELTAWARSADRRAAGTLLAPLPLPLSSQPLRWQVHTAVPEFLYLPLGIWTWVLVLAQKVPPWTISFFFFLFGLSFVLRCDFPVAVQAALELMILQPQFPCARITDAPHAKLKLTCIIVICTHFILRVLGQHINAILSVLRNIYVLKYILIIVW